MIQRIAVGVVHVALFILAIGSTTAQKYDKGNHFSKSYEGGTDLIHVYMNEAATHVVLEFENEYKGISLPDGKEVWTRKLEDENEYKHFGVVWVSDKEITLPLDKALEFVDVTTGTSAGKVEYGVGTISDLEFDEGKKTGELDSIRIRRFGNTLVMPFADGWIAVDLKNKKQLHKAKEPFDDMNYDIYGSNVLLWGAGDFAVAIDAMAPKVLYVHNTEGEDFLPSASQALIRYNDQILILLEENWVCADASTGKRVGSVNDVELSDLHNVCPLIINGVLHVLYQNDEKIFCLNVKTAKNAWSKTLEASEYGTVTNAWTPTAGVLIIATHNDDDDIFIKRLDPNTGNEKWSSMIGNGEHEFVNGLMTVTEIVVTTSAGMGMGISVGGGTTQIPNRKPSRYSLDSLNMCTYWTENSNYEVHDDSLFAYTDEEFLDMMSAANVHRQQKGHVLVNNLGVIGNDLYIAQKGQVQRKWKGGVSKDDYDGEGILKLNLETGAVTLAMAVPFFKDQEDEIQRDGLKWRAVRTKNGIYTAGIHTVAFLRTDGTIDTVGGFKTLDLSRREEGVDYCVFQGQDEDENQLTWRVNFTPTGSKKQLLGFTEDGNLYHMSLDTTITNMTIRYQGDNLYAYDALEKLPMEDKWPSPKWKITNDQFGAKEIGNIEEVDDFKNVNLGGFVLDRNSLVVVGTDAIGRVDLATGCISAFEWGGPDVKAENVNLLYEVSVMQNGIVVDGGKDFHVASAGAGCTMASLGGVEEGRLDIASAVSRSTSTVAVVDKGTNTLHVYKVSK